MFLYHYSDKPRNVLLTRRKTNTLVEVEGKNGHDYNDHISFFFEKPPLAILGKIFGKDHPVWFPGNKLFEHTVELNSLGKFFYAIVEFPEKTEMYYDTTISDTIYFKEMERVKKEKKYEGTSTVDLIQACADLKGTVDKFFKALPSRPNFKNIQMKYAPTVPHLMIYPDTGTIKVKNITQVVVGNETYAPIPSRVGFKNW